MRQQDASEAFTFITEKLDLPLITLKMDLYHEGKQDPKDDHKFINERLLEVAIPEAPEGGWGRELTLEDCLENYFNNRIEVKRMLHRRNTVGKRPSIDSLKNKALHVEVAEVSSSSITPLSEVPLPAGAETPQRPIYMRSRGTSIFSERRIPIDLGKDNEAAGTRARRKSSVRKEVNMPAWQFYRLIRKHDYDLFANIPRSSDEAYTSLVHRQRTIGRRPNSAAFLQPTTRTRNLPQALLGRFEG